MKNFDLIKNTISISLPDKKNFRHYFNNYKRSLIKKIFFLNSKKIIYFKYNKLKKQQKKTIFFKELQNV